MRIYGVDPGETTGWVSVVISDRKLVIEDVAHWSPEQYLTWLAQLVTDPEKFTLVVEDYIINPKVHKYDHQGDKGVALQLIGASKLLARLRPDCLLELQGNFRKPAGYGFLGSKYVRGKKGQHSQDALSHVMYYAVTRRYLEPIVSSTEPESPAQKVSSPRIFRVQSDSGWRRPDRGSSKDNRDKSS